MKVHILTNALDYGDAVSTHCILLKTRLAAMGIEASLYAEFSHPSVEEHVTPLNSLKQAAAEDILLHQFFNETSLLGYVERFPGPRVMMYHNITPPDFFEKGGKIALSCSEGLQQARSIQYLYDLAVGMSEFSRRDLEQLGYANTGVFPLFVDHRRLAGVAPNPIALSEPVPAHPVFLAVGRIAPNKRIEHLFEFLASYKKIAGSAFLILAGDNTQHPPYLEQLQSRAELLGLKQGTDFYFTGKIPEDYLVAQFRRAGAYLCFSEHEGFCAPLLEAMAFDLPVIAFAAGAVEETMGGSGILFREKNFEQMAAAARSVLESTEARESLIAAQRERLQAFDAKAQITALRRLIDQVTTAHQPKPSVGNPPPVSVVINTYNRGPHLERCLRALERQTYPNFEVVVVNGPSTDNTGEILKKFHGRIRVVETASRVLSESRNEGIAASRGQLVAFTDDDALPQPDWLTSLVPAFDDPQTGAAGGLVYRMNNGDVEFRNGIIDRMGTVRWDMPRPGKHWNWEGGYLNTVSGNNCIFRRSALETIGGFDERIEYYHDEADVVLRLRLAGFRTIHRPDAIVYHEAARSHNRSNPYLLNWFAITKNTVYVPLKVSPKSDRSSLGKRIISRLVEDRMRPMSGWRRNRWITFREWLRIEAQCVRGMATGFWRGYHAQEQLRTLRPADGGILQYERRMTQPLRVAILSQAMPWNGGGGIATYTWTLARALVRAGHTVHVITKGDRFHSEQREGVWVHTARPLPVNDVNLPLGHHVTRRNLEYAEGVRRVAGAVAARWGLDLIESPSWDSEGILLALEDRLPLVTRVHSPLFKVMQSQNWPETDDLRLSIELEGLLLKRSCGVVGSTRGILDLFDRHYGLRLDRTARIPLGLDPAVSSNGAKRDGPLRVLFVGRLERRKGIHTLLEAIPQVFARCATEVVFDLVGPDSIASPPDPATWTQIWNHRYPRFRDRVRFHGEVLDGQLAHYYAACDLFVAPSLFESFGLIYLEAMAQQKPVIGTRVGGIPEVVADGETGLLVAPDDARGLADAIIRLLEDRTFAERLGAAGRNRFEAHFASSVMAARQLTFYNERAAHWNSLGEKEWAAGAIKLDRHPDTRIGWSPHTGENSVAGVAGHRGKLAFGARVWVGAGTHRLECDIWIDESEPEEGWYGSIEIDSELGGVLARKDLLPGSLPYGLPAVIDLFFTVPGGEWHNVQPRIHTEGKVTLNVREMRLTKWPRREDRP